MEAQSEFFGLSQNNYVTDLTGRPRNLGDNTHGLKFIDLTLKLVFNWYASGVFLLTNVNSLAGLA